METVTVAAARSTGSFSLSGTTLMIVSVVVVAVVAFAVATGLRYLKSHHRTERGA